jgi:hypothetical protein
MRVDDPASALFTSLACGFGASIAATVGNAEIPRPFVETAR